MFKQILHAIITPTVSKAALVSMNDPILLVRCCVSKQQGADRALGSVLALVLQRITHKNCVLVPDVFSLCILLGLNFVTVCHRSFTPCSYSAHPHDVSQNSPSLVCVVALSSLRQSSVSGHRNIYCTDMFLGSLTNGSSIAAHYLIILILIPF